MLQELTRSLYASHGQVNVLMELGSTVACAVDADGWNLFVKDTITGVSHL